MALAHKKTKRQPSKSAKNKEKTQTYVRSLLIDLRELKIEGALKNYDLFQEKRYPYCLDIKIWGEGNRLENICN